METDNITLADLSLLNSADEFSVLHKLDKTRTTNGRKELQKRLTKSLKAVSEINAVQQSLKLIIEKEKDWPLRITNGTIKVIESFNETAITPPAENLSTISAYTYRLLYSADFSLIKYSVTHAFDFIKGMQELTANFSRPEMMTPLQALITEAEQLMKHRDLKIVESRQNSSELSMTEMLTLGRFLRFRYRPEMQKLVVIHAKLDALFGMALAVKQLNLCFPEIVETPAPYVEAKGLYHILLGDPVSYDIKLTPEANFIFLTGANMAGKSTFIKAVGLAVFLAHIGMGVPAIEMQLCLFDGLLSNINVIDNIVKGESYFYNEVQRIKATLLKISDGRKWLILIDELFKGTNVVDAMKCSTTVIDGLVKIKNSVFILSTHLYEIADQLKDHNNICFHFFETQVDDEQLKFNYHLRDGVSEDRIGYLIMKREGVIRMLEEL